MNTYWSTNRGNYYGAIEINKYNIQVNRTFACAYIGCGGVVASITQLAWPMVVGPNVIDFHGDLKI